ncbi:hypothetical protein IE4803_PD00269 (plasmid) [Rhizobium etli bv. phaseoli str. IE4803]|nr:hypothetical protein IE4803_PD00269 [Rhizobium etli bv. phaseoli str. IE4803]
MTRIETCRLAGAAPGAVSVMPVGPANLSGMAFRRQGVANVHDPVMLSHRGALFVAFVFVATKM